MGVRLLVDQKSAEAVMYCSTTGEAFGPVVESEELARKFLAWLGRDPRDFPPMALMHVYNDWRTRERATHGS